MNTERDVLDRLDGLDRRWYVTGSWALATYAEPRMTRDIDMVIEATPTDYDTRIRLAFERDFLVNDPIDLGGRWMGRLIHRVEIVRVDLIFGRADVWARSAMDRRVRIDHPTLGPTWASRPRTSSSPGSSGPRDRPSFSCATSGRYPPRGRHRLGLSRDRVVGRNLDRLP